MLDQFADGLTFDEMANTLEDTKLKTIFRD